MKPGTMLVLDRNWSSYLKGERFYLVAEVPCGELELADGTKANPTNLRVVLEHEPVPENTLLCRTIPMEYAVEIPKVGDNYDVDANQGSRMGTVMATWSSQFLVEYEMPHGRTFGRVMDVLNPGWYRAVPMHNLPRRWKNALALEKAA